MLLPLDYAPMEARLVDAIPDGDVQYEPKWDGFRCIAFRDGDRIELQSKSQKPLGRYFPEIVEALRALEPLQFVLDGELVIRIGEHLSFDDLLARIHPAASRVATLSREYPATYLLFDILADGDGDVLVERPLHERRRTLELFADRYIGAEGAIRLSPATTERTVVDEWYRAAGGDLDGVVAKRRDAAYASGERSAVDKVKPIRSADCVVGGFRSTADGDGVASLLLGVYDEGRLDYVGFTSGFERSERRELLARLKPLEGPPGFTGNAPGGPSRWNRGADRSWVPLRSELVAEVAFDQVTAGRFRHGTRFLRWRPDKAPRQCTRGQLERADRTGRLIEAYAASPTAGS